MLLSQAKATAVLRHQIFACREQIDVLYPSTVIPNGVGFICSVLVPFSAWTDRADGVHSAGHRRLQALLQRSLQAGACGARRADGGRVPPRTRHRGSDPDGGGPAADGAGARLAPRRWQRISVWCDIGIRCQDWLLLTTVFSLMASRVALPSLWEARKNSASVALRAQNPLMC